MRENEANLSQICFRSGAMEIFFVASLKVHFDKFATLLRFHFPARPVSLYTSWALSAMGPAYDSLIVRNKIKKATTQPRRGRLHWEIGAPTMDALAGSHVRCYAGRVLNKNKRQIVAKACSQSPCGMVRR